MKYVKETQELNKVLQYAVETSGLYGAFSHSKVVDDTFYYSEDQLTSMITFLLSKESEPNCGDCHNCESGEDACDNVNLFIAGEHLRDYVPLEVFDIDLSDNVTYISAFSY